MRIKDYFLGALILFMDFLLMYLFSFQLASKWSDACDKERMDLFNVFKDTTTTENLEWENGKTETARVYDPEQSK